jgi:hypothetical protein
MEKPNIPYLKSWLVFFLIASIGGGLVGMAVGAVIGGVMGAAGLSLEQIAIVTGATGLIIGIPISFFTFKWSVGKYIVEPMVRASHQQG